MFGVMGPLDCYAAARPRCFLPYALLCLRARHVAMPVRSRCLFSFKLTRLNKEVGRRLVILACLYASFGCFCYVFLL